MEQKTKNNKTPTHQGYAWRENLQSVYGQDNGCVFRSNDERSV